MTEIDASASERADPLEELQRLRRVTQHALDLRHAIYYAAEPCSEIERQANELGTVLAALEWGLAQLDQPVVLIEAVNPDRTCGICERPLPTGGSMSTDASHAEHVVAVYEDRSLEPDEWRHSAVPAPETFVLERVENPHADMLADALLIRANARSAVERHGDLADYDVDWRIAWKFFVRAMAKATGCTTDDLEAWMDRMEAKA